MVMQHFYSQNLLKHPSKVERIGVCHSSPYETLKPFTEEVLLTVVGRAWNGEKICPNRQHLSTLMSPKCLRRSLQPASLSSAFLFLKCPKGPCWGRRAARTCGEEPRGHPYMHRPTQMACDF